MIIRELFEATSGAQSGFVPIATLPPEEQQIALAAFAKLADDQRGVPESLGTSTRANPGMFNAMGAFPFLAEHIGDLTHRIAEKHCERMHYGYETVGEKVRRGLRYFNNGYGLKREIDGNLRNNLADAREKNPDISEAEFIKGFEDGAKKYANAHRQLVVYNEAQWHCREAAVMLGMRAFEALEHHLEALQTHLDKGVDAWDAWASLVEMAGGQPVPFTRRYSRSL